MTRPAPDSPEIAVVTGGAGGMGRAIAQRLGTDLPVLIADLNLSLIDDTVQELREHGVTAHGTATNVADTSSVAALVAYARGLGQVRTLVHTAGAWDPEMTPREVFAVNFGGAVNVLDAFGELAAAGTVGVVISSTGAHRTSGRAEVDALLTKHRGSGLWEHVSVVATDLPRAYAIAKRGVILECEIRASEWARNGARLVSISPGNFDTAMGRAGRASGGADLFVAASGPRRPGHPAEVAELVAFLASPAAAYISGCDVRIDGGALANLRHNPELAAAFASWNDILSDTVSPGSASAGSRPLT